MRTFLIRAGLATVLAVSLVGPPAEPAAAQSVEASNRLRRTLDALEDSARIRLAAPGLLVDDGLFLGMRSDSLVVAYADARFQVGLDEVEDLAVRGSRWMGISLQSGAVGLVAGAAAGYFLAYFKCGEETLECGGHARSVAVRWGLVFGTAGAAVGGFAGSRVGVWRRVFP